MARDYTTTEMLSSVKQRAMIPTSQDTYEDSDLLVILNDTVRDYLTPLILTVREEYFVTYSDTTIGTSTSFDIPSRALASKLRDILRVTAGGDIYSIPRLEPENIEVYNNASNSDAGAFYLQADKVFLKGSYGSTDSLRLKYFRRPNKLIAVSACGLVSSISDNAITCTSIPSTWTTSDTFDVIKGTPHFRSLGDDQTVTDVDTTNYIVTFTSAPSDIAVGDWICLADESPVAQVPYDVYPLLIERAASTVLGDIGDSEGAALKFKSSKSKEDKIVTMLTNRVEGENRKIVNRQNMGWKRGFWWGN